MLAVRDALAAWDGVAPGVVLQSTTDSATADVRIAWTRAVTRRAGASGARPAARTTLLGIRQAGSITGAQVEIAEAGRDGVPFDSKEVRAIALHEIGHVLGLKHRREGDSFMTPRMREGRPAAADIALLRAWYGLPAGTACEVAQAPHAAPRR